MKKVISLILCMLLVFGCLSSAFAATKVYDLSGDLPEGDEANYKPYPIALNATRYTPWFVQYARSTKSAYEKGIRAGDGNQRLMSIAVSPVNNDLMLMGSDKSGILRSDDGGINWEQIGNNNNGWGCTDIVWSPTEEKVAFCMQTGNVGASANALEKSTNTTLHGVYKTVDAGKTWYQVLSAPCLSDSNTKGLKVMPSGNVYALTSDGLFKSTDGGETFEHYSDVIEKDTLVGTIEISEDERTMLACGGGGVYYSTSKGLLWKKVNGNLDEATGASCVRIDPDDENHWYACFNDYSDGGNVFETYDNGKTWTQVKVPNNSTNKKTVRLIEFAKDPDGRTVMILAYNTWGAVYWWSDDKGKSWSQVEFDRVLEDIWNISAGYNAEGFAVVENQPNITYYSFGDQVYKSVDGGKTYRWSNSGFSGINTNCVYFDQENYMWFCDVDRGLSVTDTPYAEGTYPTVSRTGPEAYSGAVAVDPKDINHVFTDINNVLYETTDRGANWTAVDGVKPSYLVKYHKDDSNVIYTSGSTSKDGGKTWVENSMAITAVSNVNNDVLYSYNSSEKSLYQSKDRGTTWNKFSSNVGGNYVFYPDEFDENTIWYGGFNGVLYKTVNGVITAYGAQNGLLYSKGINSIMAIAQDPKDKNHLVVGGKCTVAGIRSPGIYETYDGGETWILVPGAKGTFITTSIAFSPISEEVFIGTCSNGFYVYDYKTFKQWYNGELVVDKSDEIIIENQYTDGRVRVKINGDMIGFDSNPFIENGRTFVPMRKIFETLGATIEWDNDTETVTATKGSDVIKLTIGSNKAIVNGTEKELDAPAQLRNDRTMVPLRFVSESLGLKVDWSESNNLVIIKN